MCERPGGQCGCRGVYVRVVRDCDAQKVAAADSSAQYVSAMRLSLELSDAQQQQLDAIAQRLNVPADALAAAALRDLLDRRGAEFEDAARRVMEKNAELYRRLA